MDLLRMKKGVTKNLQMYKKPKHVTWMAGLPPIEEDELQVKKKIMKDVAKDHVSKEDV